MSTAECLVAGEPSPADAARVVAGHVVAEGGVPGGYPEPMVDHHEERREALRRYEAVR